jgi:hypothetical protein
VKSDRELEQEFAERARESDTIRARGNHPYLSVVLCVLCLYMRADLWMHRVAQLFLIFPSHPGPSSRRAAILGACVSRHLSSAGERLLMETSERSARSRRRAVRPWLPP